MEQHDGDNSKLEAERLLSIASKLLQSNDLTGAREFSLLAQETDPLLDGSDQILAVADVLLAAEKTVAGDKPDHYAVLQLDPRLYPDADTLRKNYRRLALLLHPDKNQTPLSDSAFRHVAEAWAVLSDSVKKSAYDRAIGLAATGPTGAVYARVDLRGAQQKLPVRRAVEEEVVDSFWTACPYCYRLYEYLRAYEDCCLRCQNCQRAFHGVNIPSLPQFVPGREAYYCNQNFFPLGSALSMGNPETAPRVNPNGGVGSGISFVNGAVTQSHGIPTSSGGGSDTGFMNDSVAQSYVAPSSSGGVGGTSFMNGAVTKPYATSSSSGKKRGRPRKFPGL